MFEIVLPGSAIDSETSDSNPFLFRFAKFSGSEHSTRSTQQSENVYAGSKKPLQPWQTFL
jgi:hypothetical protein